MIMYKGYVWFLRERNGQWYLIQDDRPDMELRLPGCSCESEAQRLAWTLING